MSILLKDIGKKWNKEWLYRHINLEFLPGKPVVLLGTNGSGKSTLLNISAGLLTPSEGLVELTFNGIQVPSSKRYLYTALAAPYLQLYEDFTIAEAITFHSRLKSLRVETVSEFCCLLELDTPASKPINSFSSGMKQRVKLGFALLASSPFIFLDEPCSNLDNNGAEVYKRLLNECIVAKKTIVIASNADPREYPSAADAFHVQNFRP